MRRHHIYLNSTEEHSKELWTTMEKYPTEIRDGIEITIEAGISPVQHLCRSAVWHTEM